MEYFWSEGGNNRPYFSHRVKVPKCDTDMYQWCQDFNDEGRYFRRFHVEWASVYNRKYDVVQFEWSEAAVMFILTWGGENA